MNDRHQIIEQQAQRALYEIRRDAADAMELISAMHSFAVRSLAQRRRWANFRKYTNGGGK